VGKNSKFLEKEKIAVEALPPFLKIADDFAPWARVRFGIGDFPPFVDDPYMQNSPPPFLFSNAWASARANAFFVGIHGG